MTCVHKVRWSVKRPEDCRFRLSVSHYKDRIVAPDEYSGVTVVTPSDSEQVLATKDKLLRDDITVEAIKTEPVTLTENGDYFPPPDTDGFSEVVVNVPMGDWSAPVLVYEGDFSATTGTFAVTELPNGNPFSFDKIIVELSHVQQGQNVNKRTYWRSDCPVSGYNEPLIIDGGSNYRYNVTYHAVTTITIEDDTYIGLVAVNYDENNPTSTAQAYQRKAHGGYDKITAYGWWSWNCPAGTHIKITGYNKTA